VTVILMALAGFVVGFALDAVIAQLAREPYERAAEEDDTGEHNHINPLDLQSEAGTLVLPALLDGKSWYRRVAVVLATTGLFAAVGAQYQGDVLHLAILAMYTSVLVICSGTDILAYRVPNVVTYPGIITAFGIGMAIDGADRLDVILGGLTFGGILLIPSVLTGGTGMGDVKLALFVGLALGFSLVLPAMLLMAIGGGLAAVFLLVTKVRGRRDPIPYAPFIAAGALVTLLTQGVAFLELT
jgi:leader peptidase (prepilin peptidase)/N-methyltransferase